MSKAKRVLSFEETVVEVAVKQAVDYSRALDEVIKHEMQKIEKALGPVLVAQAKAVAEAKVSIQITGKKISELEAKSKALDELSKDEMDKLEKALGLQNSC